MAKQARSDEVDGMAALGIWESLLIALTELKIISEKNTRDLLTDVATKHNEVALAAQAPERPFGAATRGCSRHAPEKKTGPQRAAGLSSAICGIDPGQSELNCGCCPLAARKSSHSSPLHQRWPQKAVTTNAKARNAESIGFMIILLFCTVTSLLQCVAVMTADVHHHNARLRDP